MRRSHGSCERSPPTELESILWKTRINEVELEDSSIDMYKKKLIHNQHVDGNAYITVGDSYQAQNGNPFRQPIKGEKLKPMECPVS